MGRSPSSLVTILVSFVIVGTGSGDVMVLVCHVILQDHVIKGSRDFTGRRPSRLVSILSRLVTITILVVEIMVLGCHLVSS